MADVDSIDVIFCSRPSLFSGLVLQALLASREVNVLAVVSSTRIKTRTASNLVDVLSLLCHSGLCYTLYLWLVTSVFSVMGGAVNTGVATIRSHCRRHRIPMLKTGNINTEDGRDFIEQIIAQRRSQGGGQLLLVSAMFNQRLSAELLGIDGLECINLHPGRLPEYRGAEPVLPALLNGELQCEVSLHQTISELDAGPVLQSQTVSVDRSRSLYWHNVQLFTAGAEMLKSFLSRSGYDGLCARAEPQRGSAAYYGWPAAGQVSQYKKLISVAEIFQFTAVRVAATVILAVVAVLLMML